MSNVNFSIHYTNKIFTCFIGFLLSCVMLFGCAAQSPRFNVAQFWFDSNGETYRIRSITSEDKSESYNELIGEKFLAVDYNQDRIIDRILLGEASLSEAQKVYDYGLIQVTKQNKLQLRTAGING